MRQTVLATQLTGVTMGDAGENNSFPSQIAMESATDAGEKVADDVSPPAEASDEARAANTAIGDDATVGERQLDSETPDAADNEGGDGLDSAKANEDIDAEKDRENETDGIGNTAENGVEVADGSAENDNMYCRVRELALEAINAVRCYMVLVQKQYSKVITKWLGSYCRRRIVVCVIMCHATRNRCNTNWRKHRLE